MAGRCRCTVLVYELDGGDAGDAGEGCSRENS